MTETARDGNDWFVVHTAPRKEKLAGDHLENQGYNVSLPKKRIRKRRKVRGQNRYLFEWQEGPLFERYLFVEQPEDGNIYAINEAIGVSTILYDETGPKKLPDEVVREIEKRPETALDETIKYVRKRFKKGTRVKFGENSPFSGFSGKVLVDSGHKLCLELEHRGMTSRVNNVDPAVVAEIT